MPTQIEAKAYEMVQAELEHVHRVPRAEKQRIVQEGVRDVLRGFRELSEEGEHAMAPERYLHRAAKPVLLAVKQQARAVQQPPQRRQQLSAPPELTAYEMQRLDSIERNRCVLRDLGLERPS